MSETEGISVVYFSAATPGALFTQAAQWCNSNDGRYVIEAIRYKEDCHLETDERYELGLYFEPQT
ncbi:hypothetical protein FJK98_32105 [Micromonospora sp. HM134]|uniref:hypothetical protein n=1 Tax=Micromonospora sp. HM134 TaxID=2583243 RepID=UPI0011988DAE|nr:hypothetical protein [Micromonospora sp. HM134]QDY11211.1 hypothetical protein FJK98_32105 [Micromonospora sp. HM134]